ncbi:MAG: ABC transporter ATP-binding protein [Alphaproteobacteria bacterium]|jgi:ABC-type multidrug transport system fused ATPase/permease subunit|nr:ABC transporter ATP-binding protein [Alphaproteobacteria bacterium]
MFREHAGWRLPALFALILIGGLVEAVGILTLLPLLNAAVGDTADNPFAASVVDILQSAGVAPTILNLLLVIVVAFTLRGLLVFVSTYFMSIIVVDIRRRVQSDLTRRFGEMELSYYVNQTAGWFNNILIAEVARFVASMRSFSLLSVSVINALVLLPIAVSMKPEVTLTIFIVGGLVLISMRGLIGRTAVYSREQTRLQGQLNSTFIQLIQSFIYLKATGSTSSANQHVINSISSLSRTELRIRKLAAIIVSVKDPIAVIVLASFIYYEVEILGGSLAEVIVVALVLYRMLTQLVSLGPQLQVFNQTIGGVFAVREVIADIEPHLEPGSHGEQANLDQPLTVENVSFSHGDAAILHNLDAVIRPNETVGVVGESGSGKTTFFHLLTGMLRPNDGEIRIGDTPYRDLDMAALRNQIGYVTQDPVIFDGTAADNISLWQCALADDLGMEQVRAAARLARCDGFISELENGYATEVGDRGVRLSGGERQRIAIARELYKNPRLLIFDEASSALDAHSEQYLQDSIDSMHGERTVLIITHRLASVRDCDRIYVFSDGSIVEEGSFETLFNTPNSRFRSMCAEQGITA